MREEIGIFWDDSHGGHHKVLGQADFSQIPPRGISFLGTRDGSSQSQIQGWPSGLDPKQPRGLGFVTIPHPHACAGIQGRGHRAVESCSFPLRRRRAEFRECLLQSPISHTDIAPTPEHTKSSKQLPVGLPALGMSWKQPQLQGKEFHQSKSSWGSLVLTLSSQPGIC